MPIKWSCEQAEDHMMMSLRVCYYCVISVKFDNICMCLNPVKVLLAIGALICSQFLYHGPRFYFVQVHSYKMLKFIVDNYILRVAIIRSKQWCHLVV